MTQETESKAQEQARLRRERRTAKIQAGGAERLSKITSLSGRSASSDNEQKGRPRQPHPHDANGISDLGIADPDEVDISTVAQSQAQSQWTSSVHDRVFENTAATSSFNIDPRGQPVPPEDPMISMLQQLLGQSDPAAMSPDLANIFSAQAPSVDPEPQQMPVWKIVHTFFAICLGLYAAVVLTSSSLDASESHLIQGRKTYQIFWIFTTFELVLQSTRYFIEKGQLPSPGMLGSIAQLLPAPYASYVRLIGRYSIIYSTIVSDLMVLVFILGCSAWWRGMTGS